MVGADCFKKDLERKSFKREVEEIVNDYKGFKIYERNAEDIADRILAAHKAELERIAKGMPIKYVEPHSYACPSDVELGVDMERELCQAHVLKEAGRDI